MISKDTFATFAQYNEDIVLAALLHQTKEGFYVDVGANHEAYHSVTKYFYDRGWKGINIEPIPKLKKELAQKRKRDINLQLAVSSSKGTITFREYPDYDGYSTIASENDENANLPHKEYEVKVDTLKNIFKKHKVQTIDFLKIDVEGHEHEVLKSNDWSAYRPTVICIEANHRGEDWSTVLAKENYIRLIFDGLNEYYVASEKKDLFNNFAERAALLSHNGIRDHHLRAWREDLTRLKYLEDTAAAQNKLLQNTTNELNQIKAGFSFKDTGYPRRIKLAIKSLTIDYLRYRKKLRR